MNPRHQNPRPNQGGTVGVTFPLVLKFDDYHEAPFIEKILSQVTGRSIRATELDADPADPYWYRFRFDLRSGNPIADTLIRGGRKARELARRGAAAVGRFSAREMDAACKQLGYRKGNPTVPADILGRPLTGVALDDFRSYLPIAKRDVNREIAAHKRARAVGYVISGINPDAGAAIAYEIAATHPEIMDHTDYFPISVRGRLRGGEHAPHWLRNPRHGPRAHPIPYIPPGHHMHPGGGIMADRHMMNPPRNVTPNPPPWVVPAAIGAAAGYLSRPAPPPRTQSYSACLEMGMIDDDDPAALRAALQAVEAEARAQDVYTDARARGASISEAQAIADQAAPNPTLLPLAPAGRKWSAAAARKRIKKWATQEGRVNWDLYARAFLYRDPKNPDRLSAFKLPIADVLFSSMGGQLYAVPHGIEAAAAALEGARGGVKISRKAKAAARQWLDAYYRKMNKPPPWPPIGPGTPRR